MAFFLAHLADPVFRATPNVLGNPRQTITLLIDLLISSLRLPYTLWG